MKKDIHPKTFEITARCVCGHSFDTTTTAQRIDMDICSKCHPFFTGKQKFIDTAGRIDRFQQRYAKAAEVKKAEPKTTEVKKAEPKKAEPKKAEAAPAKKKTEK